MLTSSSSIKRKPGGEVGQTAVLPRQPSSQHLSGVDDALLQELPDAKPAGPARRLDQVPPILMILEDISHPARRLELQVSEHHLGADAFDAIFPRVEQILDNLASLVAAELELPVAHPDMAKPCRVTHGIRRTGSRAGLQLRGEVGGLND